jgi:O-antigen ligase
MMLLPSYFYSANLDYFLERLQINIPFFILPLCWLIAPQLSYKQLMVCYTWFIVGVFLIAAKALFYYLMHQSMVNELYLHSQVMPTLVTHHPTFSLMCAFAAFMSWQLYMGKFNFKFPRFEQGICLFIALFLFVFVHVFSVRIGMLVMYVFIVVETIKYGIQISKFKAIVAFLTLFVIGCFVLYNSPTFRNKIINTGQDLAVISQNTSANNQSLASRLISYQNAIEICKQTSWLFGCGLGDIKDLNTQLFQQSFPDVSKPIIPHNQFLFLLAATGITGLLFFTMAFFYPIWYFRNKLNPALYGIYLLLILAFQVEPVLQTQLGVAFSLFFLLVGIRVNLHIRLNAENAHEK